MSEQLSNEQVAFQLILHSGNARSYLMEAMYAARENNFAEAHEKVGLAKADLQEAHHSQTAIIQAEARGEGMELSILLIHAQDHLMTTICVKDLTEEIIFLHEKIK